MKQKGFAPVIILVLIALAVVGYFGYKNYWPKLQTLITPAPSASPKERMFCENSRPEVCTMECIQNPLYICGSDGKSYCSVCQACSNKDINWYEMKNSPCEGQFCGGIAGTTCPEGYSCKLNGNYPDAGGICIKD